MDDTFQHPTAGSFPGTLHYVPPSLCAFEPTKPLAASTNVSTLLWIGGLFDTQLSTQYPLAIAQALGPTWSVMTASLGSVGKGFGVSSVARDADDIAKVVTYIKELRPGGKVVIMGFSTGCQDCMEYATGRNAEKRPPVNGIILQAPVSDREGMAAQLPTAFLDEANQLALKMCREGNERDCLPNRLTKPVFGRVGVSARRWVDLASPGPNHDGSDDYFSSDFSDERLKRSFGKLPATAPLLILYSGSDGNVPESVDKDQLVQRWTQIVESAGGIVDAANGGVIKHASHSLTGQSADIVSDLVGRVAKFLERIDRGELGGKGRL